VPPAYALVGFRLEYAPVSDGPWRIGVYLTNVLDRTTQLARIGYFGGFGIDRFTLGRPREIGAEASWRFSSDASWRFHFRASRRAAPRANRSTPTSVPRTRSAGARGAPTRRR